MLLRTRRFVPALIIVLASTSHPSCGGSDRSTDVNLLPNGSFEDVRDGLPVGWRIQNFRGLESDKPASYGIDESTAGDGSRSFFFEADTSTVRFFLLSQEITVTDVSRIRVRALMKSENVTLTPGQWPQAGIAVTYYDESRNRFGTTTRFFDQRSRPQLGTSQGWYRHDGVMRVPDGTRYIDVHCVLGMSGKLWFDSLSVVVPPSLAWKMKEGRNFTYHWLPGSEFPEGSTDYQQQLFEMYASILGVDPVDQERIDYYLYPDSTSIRKTLGLQTNAAHIDVEGREIHSIYPVENHEIVHMLTVPFGKLPPVLSEGTAFYLMGEFEGEPIQPLAQRLLKAGQLPTLRSLMQSGAMGNIPPKQIIASAGSFVGYLIEFGGTEKFLKLHTAADGAINYSSFAEAFERTYGGSLGEAETVWRKTLAAADFSKDAAKGGSN